MNKYIPLIIISALGTFLRVLNISPFKIYPDAYQNLLVARNIRDLHSVVGPMGDGGLSFPPFFAWSRPGFPILMNALLRYIPNEVSAAACLSLFMGIVAVPVSYFVVKKLLASDIAGLFGSLLLALSFDHVIWGGFILTETTGVFLILLLLLAVAHLDEKPGFLDFKDFLAGIFFAAAVLVRYEYIVLLFPLLIYLYETSPRFLLRLLTFVLSITAVFAAAFTQLYPLDSTLATVRDQVGQDLLRGAVILSAIILFALYKVLAPDSLKSSITRAGGWFILIITIGLTILTVLSTLNIINVPVFRHYSLGAGYFILYDFFLFIFFLPGLTMLHFSPKYHPLKTFIKLSLVCLLPFYILVNPEMQRYWTHLIPFLLIPAAYCLEYLYYRLGKLVLLALAPLILLQLYLSFNGAGNWRNGEWGVSSYEEQAAMLLKDKIDTRSHLLVVSRPEAYYFFLSSPVQSVADGSPYLYVDHLPDNTPTYIVMDMGMRRHFPNFTEAVERSMSSNVITEFKVDRVFHLAASSYQEDFPVKVYETILGDLKSKVVPR